MSRSSRDVFLVLIVAALASMVPADLAAEPTVVCTIGSPTSVLLEAGYGHSATVNVDGTVWAWGLNASGQLGDGTTTNRNTLVRAGSLSGVVAVAAGVFHTVALKVDGTVWTWGGNADGQLGDGTTTSRSTPGQVSGLASIVAIAAGASHTLALRCDGTVWAWGDNSSGQLGDGTTFDRSQPVAVGVLSGVKAIAAGFLHSTALKTDGTVWTWGTNNEGELGDGGHFSRSTPGAVPGLSGVTQVTCGAYFNLALLQDGTLRAWGHNFYGQLGDGSNTERPSPVTVTGLNSVVAVAAGSGFSLAVRSGGGTVWSWGQNVAGELGDGTTANRNTPGQVAGIANATAVAGGEDHSLVRLANGRIFGWGSNAYGQVGTGPSPQLTPVFITDASTTPSFHPWLTMSADGGPEVTGEFASLAIDPLGRSAIAYFDRTNGDLKLARHFGTGWALETVDAANSTGWFPSLVFDVDGDPHISYVDGTRLMVRYVHKSAGVWQTPEDVTSVGCVLKTSLGLGTAKRPYIALQDCGTTRIRVLSKAPSWRDLYLNLVPGASPSLRMVGDLPRVSYFLHTPSPTTLRFLQASGSYNAWTWTTEAVPGTNNATTNSLALDAQGNPWISFYDTASQILRLAKKISGVWSVENVDTSAGNVGDWSSIALTPAAAPRISYFAAGRLKFAEKNSGLWTFDVVDANAVGDTGQYTSLAVDGAGNYRIAYFDVQNGNLKYAISQPDLTAPASPVLQVQTGRTTAVVTWTAPGDDGQGGGAAWANEVRVSSQPINESNFDQAMRLFAGPPAPPGSGQCADIVGLNRCSPYYFALKVVDDVGNESILSTSGPVATSCGGFLEILCG